jgi:hypothetical protein
VGNPRLLIGKPTPVEGKPTLVDKEPPTVQRETHAFRPQNPRLFVGNLLFLRGNLCLHGEKEINNPHLLKAKLTLVEGQTHTAVETHFSYKGATNKRMQKLFFASFMQQNCFS